uniref:BolA family member 2 n=1 Tax=Oryzias melastigma TaxID=30732 RepID=A0A3B3D4V5_ORYME
MAITADHIKNKLMKELSAAHVDVEDTSPNRCATSFKVLVVSSQFEGKPLLQRHRWDKKVLEFNEIFQAVFTGSL